MRGDLLESGEDHTLYRSIGNIGVDEYRRDEPYGWGQVPH